MKTQQNSSRVVVSFSSWVFEARHGKKPRGVGVWAFAFAFPGDARCSSLPWWAGGGDQPGRALPFAEAKREAAAEARRRAAERGVSGVSVLVLS